MNNAVRFPAISIPFNTIFTSGVDTILASEDTGLSFSTSAAVVVSPISMGGRVRQVASNFAQWRIVSGRWRFKTGVPFGALTQVGIGSIRNSDLVFGWYPDPAQVPGNYADGVNVGGIQTTYDRNATGNIPASGWKWYLPDNGVDTAASFANIRDQNHGVFFAFAYEDAITTTYAQPFGLMQFEINWELRGYVDIISESVSLESKLARIAYTVKPDDEKKGNESPVIIKRPS